LTGVAFEAMRPEDAAQVAVLAEQLGYPCRVDEVRPRIEELLALPDEQLRVARQGERVVGYIHFLLRHSLTGARRVEIAQIVVLEELRGRGIGAAMLELAEEWARSRAVKRMRLLSRATRADAHRLYLKVGYAINKTSHVFEKAL
jgi:GNAT superfamily N-acetyltransferase